MRRRSRAGSASVKSRRRKAVTSKRRAASKSTRHRRSPTTAVSEQVALFKRERDEALEQQRAASEVLRTIASSQGKLAPVFDTILANATRLCEAKFGNLYLYDGKSFSAVATHNGPAAYVKLRMREPIPAHPMIPMGRAVLTKQPVHIPDARADRAYIERFPGMVALVELASGRTLLQVPMINENDVVGMIAIYRQEVRPFTERQIELMKNFAAQAVIAIENTRLLSELRQRTDDLSESLEQQTATSEVLRVISSSPGELEPVFQAMLENATRICGTKAGVLFRYANGVYTAVAKIGVTPEFATYLESGPIRPGPGTGLRRIMETRQTIHIVDPRTEQAYVDRDPWRVATAELGRARSLLNVPMLRKGELIGAIAVFREEVRPFTEKQIELVTNFSAQAVIAIENARLLNELRESLQRQTATSEVLSVISKTPSDLQPVFRTILENATHLCAAKFGDIFRFDGNAFHFAVDVNTPPELADFKRHRGPFLPLEGGGMDRMMRTKQVIEVADNAAEPVPTPAARFGGARSTMWVPMLKDNELVGGIVIYRQEVRPFTEKEIALVTNFAAQAVIAIENTRLLDELRQSLQRQTATADVLKVISRSTFDLQIVLDTLVESAASLCEADMASINRAQGDGYRQVAIYGFTPEFTAFMADHPIPGGTGSVVGRTVLKGATIQVADVLADPDYRMTDAVKAANIRTLLGVPMLREGTQTGVITLMRRDVRPFTEKQIELVQTFADQAVIAIENVRLFDEIQDKSRQLEVASQHKSQFLANMSHELRTPLNAILGYTELMAEGAYGEPSEKMMTVLKRLEANGRHLLGLINDVLDLSKIEAGQLVLDLSDYCIQDIAQTVRSTLEPLAADKKLGFKVEVAPQLPSGHGDGRRLTQVLINLVGNAIKFTDAGEVTVKAEVNNGTFYVSVRDTGPGISGADQAKLFQEFQQADNAITRKKGGTGLGLAISKRIIEMHGGKIWVESQPGQGSTFAFALPVIVELQVEAA